MDVEQFLISEPAKFRNTEKAIELFTGCGFSVSVSKDDKVTIYSEEFNLDDYRGLVVDGQIMDFFFAEDGIELPENKTVSMREAIQMMLAPDEIFTCTTVGINSDSCGGVADIIVEGGEITTLSLYDITTKAVQKAKLDKLRKKLQNPKLVYIVDNREIAHGYSYQYEVSYEHDNRIVLISMTEGNSTIFTLEEILQMNPEFYNEDEI